MLFLELQRQTFYCRWYSAEGDQNYNSYKLRPQILELLHYAHLGVDKTRDMAKLTVYWPNIHKEIENMVKNCQTCQEMLPTKPANTLIPHPIPSSAWYTLGADVFYLDMKIYLCLIDYYRKFPIIRELPDNSTHSMKEAIKDIRI